jgi:hypothetical protein
MFKARRIVELTAFVESTHHRLDTNPEDDPEFIKEEDERKEKIRVEREERDQRVGEFISRRQRIYEEQQK